MNISDKYYVSNLEERVKSKFKGIVRVTKISAEHVDILRHAGYLIVLATGGK